MNECTSLSLYQRAVQDTAAKNVLFVTQHRDFVTGYHTYTDYVKSHLANTGVQFVHASIGPPLSPWSQTLSSIEEMATTNLPEVKGSTLTIVSLPIQTCDSQAVDALIAYILRVSTRILIVHHDSWLFFDGKLRPPKHLGPPVVTSWFGARYKDTLANTMRQNRRIISQLSTAIHVAPSTYIKDVLTSAGISSVVVPHPMKERLARFACPTAFVKRANERPTVLLSTLYKSNNAKLFGFLNACCSRNLHKKFRFVILSMELPNLEQHDEAICEGWYEFGLFSNWYNTIALLRQSVAYLDFSQYHESFGFLVREALALGLRVWYDPRGGLADIVDFTSQRFPIENAEFFSSFLQVHAHD